MDCNFAQVKDHDEIIEGLSNIESLDKYFRIKSRTNAISQSDYLYIHHRLYEILSKLKGKSIL